MQQHRTGTLIGCLRKIQGWTLDAIYTEYRRYAAHKARLLDERFIASFDEEKLLWMAKDGAFGDVSSIGIQSVSGHRPRNVLGAECLSGRTASHLDPGLLLQDANVAEPLVSEGLAKHASLSTRLRG